MSDIPAAPSLLEGFTLGNPMGSHYGVSCCPAIRENTDQKYIVKRIAIPHSQNQLDALLITGAYKDPRSASEYFQMQAQEIADEAAFLDQIAKVEGFLPFEGWEVSPMKENYLGYDVYLVSGYRLSLEKYMRSQAITHLEAVNLGLDMCAALDASRRAGMLYIDLKPGNIFVSARKAYKIGDLGFMPLRSLKFCSMPQKYCGPYTAPELLDDFNTLNETADTYALGMILYQIFNNGKLPEDRTALSAPVNADEQMAAILLKACDPDPAARWSTPAAMGQAIMDYMQLGTVNDTPIMEPLAPKERPKQKPRPETEAAEPAAAEETPEQMLAGEPVTIPEEEAPAEDIAAELPEEESILPEEPEADPVGLVDLDMPAEEPEISMDADIPEEAPAADPYAFLNNTVEPLVFEEPESGADIPAEDTVLDPYTEEVSVSSLPAVEEYIPVWEPESHAEFSSEPEAAPVAPEADTENWDQFVLEEQADLDTELDSVNKLLSESATNPPKRPSPIAAPVRPPVSMPAQGKKAAPAKVIKEVPPKKKKKHGFLRFLIGLLVVILLAAIAGAGYLYYQEIYLQTINSISIDGTLDSLTVTVRSDIADELLTVVCSDTYGTPTAQGLKNGQAEFNNLKPGTLYKITLEISGNHKLMGQTSEIYTTQSITTITSMTAITGGEDGSVLLNFTTEGYEPDEWQVVCSTDLEEDVVHVFSGHSTTVEGLSVGKSYMFELKTGDGSPLTGENTLEYTASQLIVAEDLAVQSILDGELVLHWNAPEDTTVENWKVRCYNDSFDETIMQSETTATFTGISEEQSYTVEVTADGMTQPTRITISDHPIMVTNMNIDGSASDGIHVTWDTVGLPPDGGWLLLYSIDGSTPTILKTQASSAVVSTKIPEAKYTFTLHAADDTSVFGGEATYTAPKAEIFLGHAISGHKLSITLLPYPGNGWNYFNTPSNAFTDTFKPGQAMSLVLKVSANFYLDDDPVNILYVIRDENGNVLPDLAVPKAANWAHLWDATDYHYASLDACKAPSEPGSYTLTMYMNGMIAASAPFTVS